MLDPTPLLLSTGELAAVTALGVVCLGAGVALLVDAARSIRFRRRALSAFERVDATVLDAAVHEPVTGGPEAVPHVEYEYTVDGENYTSRSIWPTRSRGPDRVDRDVARRIVEDHPSGSEKIVRYDPQDPAVSYLVDQVDVTGERIELAVGTVLVLVVLVLAAVLVGGV